MGMKQLIAIVLVLWAVFAVDGVLHGGDVEHIEGDFDENDRKIYWVWIDGEEYCVPSEELALAWYEDGVCEKISVG